ncbi:MAG: archaellin/type IV pilin N-terminal domain-containing protein [Candidatus Odinarchaeota archaeon]
MLVSTYRGLKSNVYGLCRVSVIYFKINTLQRLFRRRRAISPVIASVLLIALAVIGGLLVLGLLSAVFNQQEPINIQFVSVSNFKSSEQSLAGYDSKVDYFEITLQNMGSEAVFFLKTNFRLKNESNGLYLNGWWIEDSRAQIVLYGGEIVTFSVTTDIDSQELEVGWFVRMEIAVINRLENPDAPGYTGFYADSLKVADTYGPLDFQERAHVFNDTHWNLNFHLQNYGSKKLKVGLIVNFFDETAFKLDNFSLVIDLDGSGLSNDRMDLFFTFEKLAGFKPGTTYHFIIKVYDAATGHLFGLHAISGSGS